VGENDLNPTDSNWHTMTMHRIFVASPHRSSESSGELMKISKPLIAITAVALMPLAAFAGDKDKTAAPMGTTTGAHFDKLDTNRDGRISQSEASSDPRLMFTSVDKNGDGYLDSGEYAQRDMSHEQMPNKDDPTANKSQPRQ
jgi:hypothetical protein